MRSLEKNISCSHDLMTSIAMYRTLNIKKKKEIKSVFISRNHRQKYRGTMHVSHARQLENKSSSGVFENPLQILMSSNFTNKKRKGIEQKHFLQASTC